MKLLHPYITAAVSLIRERMKFLFPSNSCQADRVPACTGILYVPIPTCFLCASFSLLWVVAENKKQQSRQDL